MRLSLSLLALLLLSCAPKNVSNPKQLPPPPKAAEPCMELNQKLTAIATRDESILRHSISHLADQKCTVSLLFINVSKSLASMKRIKNLMGHYTNFPAEISKNKIEVFTLSIEDPKILFAPVLDPKTGEELSTQETTEECELAATRLHAQFPFGRTIVRKYQTNNPRDPFCYVDLEFFSDSDFERFFAWKNLDSIDGSITQMHFLRTNQVTSTVKIRPLRAED